jgi:hypothetical protein
MAFLILKYAVTALVIVVVSEVAKRSDRAGALIASLPLVTVMAMIWLYVEKQPDAKIANHAYYTFWYVLPTMPMFSAHALDDASRRELLAFAGGGMRSDHRLLRHRRRRAETIWNRPVAVNERARRGTPPLAF